MYAIVCAEAVCRQPATRGATSYGSFKSGIRGSGVGAAYDAKEPALGPHGRRHGAIALNLLLEG